MARIKCLLCPEYLGADEIDEHYSRKHPVSKYDGGIVRATQHFMRQRQEARDDD